MCFSYVTRLTCSLIIWGQLDWGQFSLLAFTFVKDRVKVKQISDSWSNLTCVPPPPPKASVCLTAHCFICLRKITTFCKYFKSLWSSWNIILTRAVLFLIQFVCLSCFHQVGIRAFSTASSVIGQRQTFQNTFLSFTTSAAFPSTPISQHSSSEWELTC